MGVKHLWQTLSKGGAVEVLDGADPRQHAQIMEELEGSVVAVDLSAWCAAPAGARAPGAWARSCRARPPRRSHRSHARHRPGPHASRPPRRLMQAQTQPAMAQAYVSEYACALKLVFDRVGARWGSCLTGRGAPPAGGRGRCGRAHAAAGEACGRPSLPPAPAAPSRAPAQTIHWLRHGCLPLFVVEGATPPAKLDKLRSRCGSGGGGGGGAGRGKGKAAGATRGSGRVGLATPPTLPPLPPAGRCMAAYGPAAGQWRVGNSASGPFSSLGRKCTELLDLLVDRGGRRSRCRWQTRALCPAGTSRPTSSAPLPLPTPRRACRGCRPRARARRRARRST
jgi:hypothetical protein